MLPPISKLLKEEFSYSTDLIQKHIRKRDLKALRNERADIFDAINALRRQLPSDNSKDKIPQQPKSKRQSKCKNAKNEWKLYNLKMKSFYKRKLNSQFESKTEVIDQTKHKKLDDLREELKRKLDNSTVESTATGRLPWDLLPRGNLGLREINQIIVERKIDSKKGFEWERIEFAYSLNPKKIYVGRSEFSGYFVFIFSNTKKVLLENPFYGNAAYIFNSDWTSLSKLSRSELTRSHHKIVERVSHAAGSLDWKERLKYKLELQS